MCTGKAGSDFESDVWYSPQSWQHRQTGTQRSDFLKDGQESKGFVTCLN